MQNLISSLFSDVRLVLDDSEGNIYSDNLLTSLYNRIVSELSSFLMMMGAEIHTSEVYVVGDGINNRFDLPSDFLAFVPSYGVCPRMPEDSITAFGHGTALMQVGSRDAGFILEPSVIGQPDRFVVVVDSGTQKIMFNCIPSSGHIFDMLYYPEIQKVAVSNIGSTYTPWLGILDGLISRSLEEYAREGKEFTTEKRILWKARTESDVAALLGLRHIHELSVNPSVWKGLF